MSQEPSAATPFWFAPSPPRLRRILCRGLAPLAKRRAAHVPLNIPPSQSTQSSGYTLHRLTPILKLVVATSLLATVENAKSTNMGVR